MREAGTEVYYFLISSKRALIGREAMLKVKRCPTCGSERIKKVCRNWTGRSQGKRYTVPDLEFYVCPNCGEKVYGPQAMRKIENHSPAFRRQRLATRSA